MKLVSLSTLINRAFQFVILNSEQYRIDESHALKHSLDVYHYATQIYNSELPKHPILESQQPVIYASAILHDMCDKKYMDEAYGLANIREYMKDYLDEPDMTMMSNIINTMSYSKVKQYGFPDLGDYQMAYHIVRESDLLAGYDVTRSIIYQMMHEKYTYSNSLDVAKRLFDKRMFTHISDDLFITDFSKKMASQMHINAQSTITNIINPIMDDYRI
jgi:hypothetical protein